MNGRKLLKSGKKKDRGTPANRSLAVRPDAKLVDDPVPQQILRDLQWQLKKLMPSSTRLSSTPEYSSPAELLLIQRSVTATRDSAERCLEKLEVVLVRIESLESRMRPTRRQLVGPPEIVDDVRGLAAAFIEIFRAESKRVPGSCFQFFSQEARREVRRVALIAIRLGLEIQHLASLKQNMTPEVRKKNVERLIGERISAAEGSTGAGGYDVSEGRDATLCPRGEPSGLPGGFTGHARGRTCHAARLPGTSPGPPHCGSAVASTASI